MDIVNCLSCGTPIDVDEKIPQLKCKQCGAFLKVHRREGLIEFELIDWEEKQYQYQLEALKNELFHATGRLNNLLSDVEHIRYVHKELKKKIDYPTQRHIRILLDNAKREREHIRQIQRSLQELQAIHGSTEQQQKPKTVEKGISKTLIILGIVVVAIMLLCGLCGMISFLTQAVK